MRHCPRCKTTMQLINAWAGHRCPACLTFRRPDGTLFKQGVK